MRSWQLLWKSRLEMVLGLAPVVQVYYPVYLEGWDQEDHSSNLAPGKYFSRPYLKNTQHKKWLVEWLKCYSAYLASVRPWIQAPITQKNKNEVMGDSRTAPGGPPPMTLQDNESTDVCRTEQVDGRETGGG
jgi:hypothetical protein